VVLPGSVFFIETERSIMMNRSIGTGSASPDTPLHALSPACPPAPNSIPVQASVGYAPLPPLPVGLLDPPVLVELPEPPLLVLALEPPLLVLALEPPLLVLLALPPVLEPPLPPLLVPPLPVAPVPPAVARPPSSGSLLLHAAMMTPAPRSSAVEGARGKRRRIEYFSERG
jgi:hypothetical protein